MRKLIIAAIGTLCLTWGQILAQAPTPDAYYTFDEVSGTTVADSMVGNHDAYWYNYFGEDPGSPQTSTGGWRASEGYRNGAAYFAGDHVVCPDDCPDPSGGNCTCSSGADLLIFGEDQNDLTGSCDDNRVSAAANGLFRGSSSDLTVSFWFKNDWNYLCPVGIQRFCYNDSNDCAWERQVLYTSGGSTSGITIAIEPGATFPALIRVWLRGGESSTVTMMVDTASQIWDKKWLHVAVTFEGDGASAGTATFYLNGEQRRQATTDFGSIELGPSSTVFGGEHGASVSGFDVGTCWPNNDLLLCGITSPFYNTIRYGWPARGWLDEMAYWSEAALTQQEIVEFARMGDTTTTSLFPQRQALSFRVVPSPTQGQIYLRDLPPGRYEVVVLNSLGQELYAREQVSEGTALDLPTQLSNGIYFLHVRQQDKLAGIQKFVLNR